MRALRQRIAAQVDEEIARDGLLDNVKTPEDQKTFDLYRRLQIDSRMMLAKLAPKPKLGRTPKT
jgi:hypothetical protein